MVVPVLMMSCQVSLNPKKGPEMAQTISVAVATANAPGCPVMREVHLANLVKSVFFLAGVMVAKACVPCASGIAGAKGDGWVLRWSKANPETCLCQIDIRSDSACVSSRTQYRSGHESVQAVSPLIVFEDRPSNSPLIDRVWRSHSERAGTFQSISSCTWDMVITRLNGSVCLTVRGPETRATLADCPAEGEWFGIRFKVGTFMPHLRPGHLRDRNDLILPNATGHSFWLNGSAWEFPDFENAETFVQQLVREGLLVQDRLVEDVLRGHPQTLTTRTEQRRFLHVTGLTRGQIHQIERARHATNLLKQGASIPDVAFEAGYYDQAHFTRSLKRWIGRTPAQIAREEEQLSLLYNTRSE